MAGRDDIHHSEHWASQFVEHTGTLLEEELRKVAGHLQHPVPAQPLPRPPSAKEPTRGFSMSLAEVLEQRGEETAHSRLVLREADALSFHLVGDTGGHALRFGDRFPPPQRVVAYHLAQDAHRAPRSAPVACLFHLGDLVYHYGETSGYPDQFHAPYGVYPEPIFAIPGNHDAMVEPRSEYPSLEAFAEHFCAPPGTTRCSCPVDHAELMHWRRPMTQPNVYFTLETPACWFIGLATNAPAGSPRRGGWGGDGELELSAFNDTHHGFLRVTVSATHLSASYLMVPSSLHGDWSLADAARAVDRFEFPLPAAG